MRRARKRQRLADEAGASEGQEATAERPAKIDSEESSTGSGSDSSVDNEAITKLVVTKNGFFEGKHTMGSEDHVTDFAAVDAMGSEGPVTGFAAADVKGSEGQVTDFTAASDSAAAHIYDDSAAVVDALDPETEGAWRDAVVDEETLPIFDERTHEVRDSMNPSQIIGRIIPCHEGTTQESITVYCRLHQCKKMKRARVAPSVLQIRRWFQAGVGIARGKAHQAAHLELWNTCCAPGSSS